MDHIDNNTFESFTGPGLGRGTNQMGMREANERVVLSLLRKHPNLAKAEIARHTGLSAQTVARLIKALEADGLILRGEPSRGRIGQPSVPLSLNPDGAVFLGMKVGRRSVEMAVVNLQGQIIDREKLVYEYPDFDQVLTFASLSATRLTNRLSPALRQRIGGLGIAMPFFLWSWDEQIGVDPAQMADWKTRDLQAEIADKLGLPVLVQNDATSVCSAEIVFGKSTLPANVVSFYLAFFVGGGLALRSAVYEGATGNAAGFGPLRVLDLAGNTRPLIDLASLESLEKALAAEGHDPHQIWLDAENWSLPAHIVEKWTAECANALAQAVQSAQTILDLDLVLIDGWLPRALCADLTERVSQHLAKLDMTGMHLPKVQTGTLGADARLLGAASLPLSRRFLAS